MTPHFYFLTHGGEADPFWQPVKEGVDTASSALGVQVTYKGATGKFSIDELSNNLQDAVKNKPDGIVVTIPEARRLRPELEKAHRDKIPVIAVNVPDFNTEKAQRVPYAFYIGMDEYLCGFRIAERLFYEYRKGISPKKALVITHERPHDGFQKRLAGIKDVFTTKGVDVEEFRTSPDEEITYTDLKQRLKDSTIDIVLSVFTLGPLGTRPVLRLFREDCERLNQLKLACVDRDEQTDQDIQRGRIVCTADQSPFLQGYLPIHFLHKRSISGLETLEGRDVYLGPIIVDSSNVSAMAYRDASFRAYGKARKPQGSGPFRIWRYVALRAAERLLEGFLRDTDMFQPWDG